MTREERASACFIDQALAAAAWLAKTADEKEAESPLSEFIARHYPSRKRLG